MQDFQRYAIYFTPERDTALARFGNAWLGFDPDTSNEVERPDFNGITTGQIRRLTEAPARYGFHGTLKAPFHLPPDRTFESLDRAIEKVSSQFLPFEILRLGISRIGDFLALTPTGPAPLLSRVADSCVVELDGFRAKPCEQELQRHRAKGLLTRQEHLLRQWGYPFVMEEFRFHLTLTGNLEPSQCDRLRRILSARCMPFLEAPVPFREISLFGDPGEGRHFQLIKRYQFKRI